MNKPRILIVDDEVTFGQLAANWLEKQGFECVCCVNSEEACYTFKAQSFDLVLLDLALPPTFLPQEGLQLLSTFSQNVPVIVMTGHAERELALKAIELGAWDFLSKPLDPDMLMVVVKRAIEKHQLTMQLKALQSQLQQQSQDCGLIGLSDNIRQIRELIGRIGPTEVPVLINGPSGTGKELIAQAVHQSSLRVKQPFISVHCGAITESLMESELFGYKRGAFTGADKDKKGLLALADGGTLFLDEIGEMPLSMQVKLLRVLQEGSFYPVGGRAVEHVNCRIVSATNQDLNQMMSDGVFREDFYYRIKGLTITTTALDERKEDISVLLDKFISDINQSLPEAIQEAKKLSVQSLQWFLQQSWPGNVRQLRNAIQSVAAISANNTINLSDIGLMFPDKVDRDELPADATLEQQVQALEIRLIKQALQYCHGNKSQTALQLGLSRQGLLNKMERYQL